MKSARIFGLLFVICLCLSGSSVLAITPLKPYPVIKEASTNPSRPETSSIVTSHVPDAADKATVIKSYSRLPLSFERNDGQAPDEVKFLARWGGRVYWFTSKEVVLDFAEKENATDKMASLKPDAIPEKKLQRHTVRISFPGSKPDVKIEGIEQQEGKVNYFIGNDKSRWCAGVPIYSGVIYRNLWPGIDLKYEGRGGNLKYEFVVAPGVDPGLIRLAYSGIENMKISDSGELVVSTKLGDLVEAYPVVYQLNNGQKKEIRAVYQIMDGNKIGFILIGYNSLLPLVIDPLMYSTYLGGSGTDVAMSIAVDNSGNAYITGYTRYDIDDAFVAKLNMSGSLVYRTYLSGSSYDMGYAVAVDSSGNAYVTGYTNSTDFPTFAPFQAAHAGGSDVFVAKLNAVGSLVYSTFLGGSACDGYCSASADPLFVTGPSGGISVDEWGNVYVTGTTESHDFPTANAIQASIAGGLDVFVTKLNASGTALVYSTYLGGGGREEGRGIAVDDSGNAYVTGRTNSGNFPTASPLQTTLAGGYDAFITKFDSDGSIIYSTYLGGNKGDLAYGIAVDGSGNVFLIGWTESMDFPTANPVQPAMAGVTDVFLTKINHTGSVLFYSTYIGGGNMDEGYGIAVDGQGNAYITGTTWSSDFPTSSPYQATTAGGTTEVFITKLNSDGSGIIYSTYLGGGGYDMGFSIAIDASGDAYVTGLTSGSFPIINAYQSTYGGGYYDAFVAKISTTLTNIIISGTIKDANGVALANAALTFSNGGGTAYTGANGYYAHSLPLGWSGTVVPGPNAYGFYPAQRVYNNVQWAQPNQDYLVGYRLNLNISPSGGGSSNPFPQIPTSGLYPFNQSLTLTAITSYGYAFSHWSGDALGTANPFFNFIMNGHKNVTAVFQEILGMLATISGTVKDTSLNPIEGATITFSGGGETASVQTNASGYYEKRLALGWSGTSSAQKTGYISFNPPSISYQNVTQNIANQNFSGTPAQSERDCRAIIVAGSGD